MFRGKERRSGEAELSDIIFLSKLFKNQQYPFVVSKIFYTFAVQKADLS